MKRLGIIEAFVVLLFFGNSIRADVGQIINGSFEDNNDINDITVQEPNGWDVNIPDTNKFGGYVDSNWPTDGSYNLTVYSEWFQTFDANDMATVSQQVDPNYAEGNPHTLSLGLRVNNAGTLGDYYITQWDYVEFEFYCGSNGFQAADFSRDCYVDERDLRMLSDMWLKFVEAENKYNLYPDDDLDPLGVIDFRDFAVFANSWLRSSYD